MVDFYSLIFPFLNIRITLASCHCLRFFPESNVSIRCSTLVLPRLIISIITPSSPIGLLCFIRSRVIFISYLEIDGKSSVYSLDNVALMSFELCWLLNVSNIIVISWRLSIVRYEKVEIAMFKSHINGLNQWYHYTYNKSMYNEVQL